MSARTPASPTTGLKDLVAAYSARTPTSAARYAAASTVLPNGETRSVTHWAPHPLAIAGGAGARLEDVDGNVYIDLVNNYTSLVHGNAFTPVTDAITELVSRPLALAATTAEQTALARILIDRIGSVDAVRFTNSGSEANALALRIARHVTGRRVAVVFTDSYHSALPLLIPGEADVRVATYNDPDSLNAILDDDVAAVFAEPFLGAGGVIPAAPGFLRTVQEAAHRVGALFVLDEVQSLRNAHGGEQTLHSVTPDLTTMGKIIGGGFPIGAVGGPQAVMAVTDTRTPDPIAHSGTFNGHLFATTAGAVVLQHLTTDAIAALDELATRLEDGIVHAAARVGTTVSVSRSGSILQVHPTAEPTRASLQTLDTKRWSRGLHLALLSEGVYATPRGMINLSTALTEADVDDVITAYGNAIAILSAHVTA